MGRLRASLRCGRYLCAGLAALAMTAQSAAAADWLGDSVLRGPLSNDFVIGPYSNWEGFYVGAQGALGSMNTDFANSTGPLVAYILRDTTLEDEASPSNWTTLPTNLTNGHSYGAFVGYNIQMDRLVLGADLAYNYASGFASSVSDTISRQVTTSDGVVHDVTITGGSSLKLIDYATLVGRAGFAIGQFLPYAEVGAALGRFNYSTSATVTDIWTPSGGTPYQFGPITDSVGQNNKLVGGFVAGLGADVAIVPNVFLRGEWQTVAFAKINGTDTVLNSYRVGIGARF